MNQSPLLSVNQLAMRFGGLVAIDSVSLTASRGQITALIGPNGAGKTTLFNCLTGFYRPSSGSLSIARNHGQPACDITGWPTDRIVREAGIARTFQNIRLFRNLTVYENLLAAQHHKLTPTRRSWLAALIKTKAHGARSTTATDQARAWLGRLDLLRVADQMAGDLPYGLQRRAEIARALCTEPSLLCLDEPAAGLNPQETAALSRFLRTLTDQHNVAVFLIEHDMRLVMDISDHIHVLDYGRLIASGAPQDIRRDPTVIRAYLGESDA